ncbi:MAG: RDD family protein [Chloroflexi bacterium]|nr:RDD family protein [Chloroflexota bacterium]
MTSHVLADFGTRLAAFFIDGAILFAIESVGFITARGPGVGVGFFIGLLYAWFFLTRNNGQTPGKMLMRIRVIKVDGSPISDSEAVLRYIGYILNSVLLIGWFLMLIDEKRQGWHDKLANTYVVVSG